MFHPDSGGAATIIQAFKNANSYRRIQSWQAIYTHVSQIATHASTCVVRWRIRCQQTGRTVPVGATGRSPLRDFFQRLDGKPESDPPEDLRREVAAGMIAAGEMYESKSM